ncbi:MAG: iron dicitrate transport regulator FecR [Synechococcus sp.]
MTHRFAAALTLAAIALAASPPLARAAETATVQEILDGNQLYIDQKQAKVKARASAPQVVSTQDSRGQLLFSGGAAGRLNRFPLLKLGSSCFLMEKGQILVSGKQNGCTRSARMSVRGTNYLIDVQEDGSSELSVLEGSVEVEPLREGEPTGSPATTVEAGQKLKISPVGVILTLLKLSSGDYSAILGGPLFSGYTSQLPGFGALESYIRSSLPGVSLPSVPSAPVIPSIPRFGLF